VATQQELAGPLTTSVATTVMGYGGLLAANHVGLRSIGAVAVLGLLCCWLTGVALMPGALAWLSRRRAR
jgi:predicted RND superfamily exporter protein